jgi:hypothetical protein
MFASQVPDYLSDDLLGTTRTHAQDNFNPDHVLYRKIDQLATLARDHPALRDGAHQHRYSSDGAGVYAFSRLHRGQQREYVVVLNNSETEKTAAIPTYVADGAFQRIYGSGPRRLTSNDNRRLSVTVPALSTVVYQSVRRIPQANRPPQITLNRPRISAESNSRMRVSANVSGASFNQVSFYAKTGKRGWKYIGTDDTRPYRVFHDVSSIEDGKTVAYRAVVGDNAGHKRKSSIKRTVVPAPKLTIKLPAEGAGAFGTIEVRALADPEESSHVVRIQRRLSDGAWQTVRRDRSSPVYSYFDDLSTVPVGTTIQYRAILREPDGTRVVSTVRTVNRVTPQPLVDSVTIAGSLQSEIGCPTDWDPACATSHLTFEPVEPTGAWRRTFHLPEGTYEYKVAINDSFTVSYGASGGGDNITLTVPAGGADVTFTWDQMSHVVTHQVDP